jgi:hypothetical protein
MISLFTKSFFEVESILFETHEEKKNIVAQKKKKRVFNVDISEAFYLQQVYKI